MASHRSAREVRPPTSNTGVGFGLASVSACLAAGVGVGLLGSPLRGPGSPTKEGSWGAAGPHPPGESGCAPGEPAPPGSTLRNGLSPGARFGLGDLELDAAQLCLSDGLATDSKRGPDLRPVRALGPGGVNHAVGGQVDPLTGVSQGLEVLQGPLGTSTQPGEDLGGSSRLPASVGAFLGAHEGTVNRCSPAMGGNSGVRSSTLIDADNSPSNGACSVLAPDCLGAPSVSQPLISSYIFQDPALAGPGSTSTQNRNDPREVAASGGRGHQQEMTLWRQ